MYQGREGSGDERGEGCAESFVRGAEFIIAHDERVELFWRVKKLSKHALEIILLGPGELGEL